MPPRNKVHLQTTPRTFVRGVARFGDVKIRKAQNGFQVGCGAKRM